MLHPGLCTLIRAPRVPTTYSSPLEEGHAQTISGSAQAGNTSQPEKPEHARGSKYEITRIRDRWHMGCTMALEMRIRFGVVGPDQQPGLAAVQISSAETTPRCGQSDCGEDLPCKWQLLNRSGSYGERFNPKLFVRRGYRDLCRPGVCRVAVDPSGVVSMRHSNLRTPG